MLISGHRKFMRPVATGWLTKQSFGIPKHFLPSRNLAPNLRSGFVLFPQTYFRMFKQSRLYNFHDESLKRKILCDSHAYQFLRANMLCVQPPALLMSFILNTSSKCLCRLQICFCHCLLNANSKFTSMTFYYKQILRIHLKLPATF